METYWPVHLKQFINLWEQLIGSLLKTTLKR